MEYVWNDSLSVGYELIDRQHQRLFAIANDLTEAVDKANEGDSEGLRAIISDLLAYTRNHFSEEEPLMQQAGFPDFLRHKAEHDALIDKICEVEELLDQGEVHAVAAFLPTMIVCWLTHHIAVEDQRYTNYVQSF